MTDPEPLLRILREIQNRVVSSEMRADPLVVTESILEAALAHGDVAEVATLRRVMAQGGIVVSTPVAIRAYNRPVRYVNRAARRAAKRR